MIISSIFIDESIRIKWHTGMIFYIDSHRTDIFFGDTIFLIEYLYMTIESICLDHSRFSICSIEWDEYSYKYDTSNDFYKREMSRGNQKWKKYEY